MCGLVGMAGRITEAYKKMFKELLVVDSLRGPHSTGVLTVGRDKSTEVGKSVGNPWDLFDRKSFDKQMSGTKSVLLGHNRYATKGAINKVNAHPFEFDNVIGAHNGTLRQQSLLDDWHKFDVDSENLYYHMDKHGLEDCAKKLNGAYALTWYDVNNHSINFLRNDERPLCYCFTKDRKTVLWASEAWMLMSILHRNKEEFTDIVYVKEHTHYELKIPTGTFGNEPAFVDVEINQAPKYVAPVYSFPKPSGSSTNGNKSAGTSGTASTQNPPSCQDYAPYLGSDFDFVVQGDNMTDQGEMYIEAHALDDENINVRIYAEYKSDMWNTLMGSNNAFQGFGKRYTPKNGGYILVDLRTIIELEGVFDEEVDEETYPLYGGRTTDLKGFMEKTHQGCCWCSASVGPKDAKSIEWISPDEFLCEDCKSNPTVTQYFTNM